MLGHYRWRLIQRGRQTPGQCTWNSTAGLLVNLIDADLFCRLEGLNEGLLSGAE